MYSFRIATTRMSKCMRMVTTDAELSSIKPDSRQVSPLIYGIPSKTRYTTDTDISDVQIAITMYDIVRVLYRFHADKWLRNSQY